MRKRIIAAKNKIEGLAKGGFFYVLIGNTLTKMLTFISSIVIVRLVSKEEFAYLSYSDNLYLYVIAISGLGMSSAVLKYCGPQYKKEEDKAYFHFAIRGGFFVELMLSVLIVIYVWFADIPFPEAKGLVSLMILYPAMNYVVATFQSYARAWFDNKVYARIGLLQSAIALTAGIVFVKSIGIYGMAFARYLSMGICCIAGGSFAKKKLEKCDAVKIDCDKKKKFIELSLSFMFASLFSMIMPINETFLINYLLRDEIISSNYKVSMLIPSQTIFISNSIGVYFFSILNQIENKKQLWRTIKKIELFSAALISMITIVGILIFPYIIKYVYGEKYMECIGLSNIYWIVYGINSGFRLVALNLIPAFADAKVSAIVSIGSALVHAMACFLIVPIYGVYGAAIVLGIIYFITGCIYWIYIYKYCKSIGERK